MLSSFRRRALVAAALAALFILPLPVATQGAPAEPVAMQVAKRGDIKKRITVETQNFTVVFSEAGARIEEFRNRDTAYPLRDGANIVVPNTEIYLAPYLGDPNKVDLTLANLTSMMYAAFTFTKTEDADAVRIIATTPVQLVVDKNRYEATFSKEFVFLKKAPYFKFSLAIDTKANVKLKNLMLYALPMIGPAPEGSPGNFRDYHHYSHAEKFEQVYSGGGGAGFSCGGSASAPKKTDAPIDFFGSSSRFLILNMQPLFKTLSTTLTPEVRSESKQLLNAQALHINMGDVVIEKGKPARFEFIGYMGPKLDSNLHPNEDARRIVPELSQFHKNLYKSFDFGITEPIRDIIVSALNLLYKVIPNYGIGIILIALLLKLAFFPLNQKQAEAMKRMGELQPKIKEINERYKNNPQEKQRRIMEMYKTHKVNPVSGCLPMLIQLPVFIAMYSAFSDAYDLWKSPFIPGWIPDLSQPDHVFSLPATLPFIGGFAVHLMPVVMTLTQFYQTKLTPTSGDENQRKIMLLMPFMMLFLFYAMPSGVVLYWTVQNMLSIAQQVYTNHKNSKALQKA
jgi:YidC/Oxa1 family membrane protein insertase